MLEWLIIGGGFHGTYLSLYLTRRKRIPADAIRVLDPYDHPLALWDHLAHNTGMEFLRSSHAHNLHFDPFSLVTFTRTLPGQPLAQFIEPYGRPSLELFHAHTRHLIERYQLDKLRLVGRAQKLLRLENGWRVETENQSIVTRNVIIAIGNTENPYWPDWAQSLRQSGASIHHIFDPAFQREALPEEAQILVVGGGITAAQTAVALAVRSPGHVTLLMRHPVRVHQFDSDTGWITPLYLNRFHAEHDYARRRAMITKARHRGSMPGDVADELNQAVENHLLTLQEGDIVGAKHVLPLQTASFSNSSHDTIELMLSNGETIAADHVVLATGFETRRPGGAWLDEAITAYDLPLAPDGFPVVDQHLCWSPGLYVSGPLAELEIGPVSRNMVGVRLAAERIGASL